MSWSMNVEARLSEGAEECVPGDLTLVTASYDGTLVLARTPPDSTAQIGDTVWLRFESEKLCLIDPASGRGHDPTH
jgi:hypothetical protein